MQCLSGGLAPRAKGSQEFVEDPADSPGYRHAYSQPEGCVDVALCLCGQRGRGGTLICMRPAGEARKEDDESQPKVAAFTPAGSLPTSWLWAGRRAMARAALGWAAACLGAGPARAAGGG